MDTVTKSGCYPVSRHQSQPEYGTGRPNLFRETKFSGANGDRKKKHELDQHFQQNRDRDGSQQQQGTTSS